MVFESDCDLAGHNKTRISCTEGGEPKRGTPTAAGDTEREQPNQMTRTKHQTRNRRSYTIGARMKARPLGGGTLQSATLDSNVRWLGLPKRRHCEEETCWNR